MKSMYKGSWLQRGIGLLELMLALAIIAVLLIMATRYYQSTSQAQKVNQAAQDIQAIIAAVANFRAGDPNGTFAITDLSGFLPSTWASPPATDNPWGGSYTAAAVASLPTQVAITVTGMPNTACDALAALTKVNAVAPPACASGTMTGTYGTTNQ
jgi:type II secretory pathway pseudopilin PulG